jgi:hypothetical protein
MNAGTHHEIPQENTVPTCYFHAHATLKDASVMLGSNPTYYIWLATHIMTPHLKPPHLISTYNSYCNDRFAAENLDRKIMKYQPLIDNITTKGWNVAPLIVLAAGARGTTHIPSMKKLETMLKLPIKKIKTHLNKST